MAEQKRMITLLAFNVKIKKSILNYFIAEESSNVTVLDGKISWCRYLFGDRGAPLENGRFGTGRSLRFASKWPQPLGPVI